MSDEKKPKEIWLPKSEMTVTVQDGKVWISESMKMELKTIKRPTGFS